MLKFFLIILLFLLFPNTIFAVNNFNIDENVEYKVQESGNTFVTHTITIQNESTYDYAKNYILELSNLKPTNISACEKGTQIPLELKTSNEKNIIDVRFDKPVTGKGSSRTFVVTYEEPNLASLNGDVWEISIPRILETHDLYKVILTVPENFGGEAILYPEAIEKKLVNNNQVYIFDGKDLQKFGINAVFGKFQAYSLKLLYHLHNSNDKKDTLFIAIPSDTSTQRVFYTKITPEPFNIKVDDDGNWIAEFIVPPKKVQDITVEGYAQVFANPVKLFTPYPSTMLTNLKSQLYWEVEDQQIKEIAKHLNSSKDIFDFVTENLSYDYDRITPNVERLGAKGALSANNHATCAEFTDLFITLSRASGIPAREINGYAYSENPQLQPLSSISDILHAWPEYWDDAKQNWIPVDPTWSATSGINYFDKFDLNHIAFVTHGKSSTQPLSAGSYKTAEQSKDVYIYFADLPQFTDKPLLIDYNFKKSFNLFRKSFVVKIINNNERAVYDIHPVISYPGSENKYDNITVLPPFGYQEVEYELPIGLFAIKTPGVIKVNVNGTQKDIVINRTLFVMQQLLLFLTFLLIIMIYVGIKTKKIKLNNIFIKLRNGLRNSVKNKKNTI